MASTALIVLSRLARSADASDLHCVDASDLHCVDASDLHCVDA